MTISFSGRTIGRTGLLVVAMGLTTCIFACSGKEHPETAQQTTTTQDSARPQSQVSGMPRGSLLSQPSPGPSAEPAQSGMVTTPTGLQYQDLQVGQGAQPQPGQTVTVHYNGYLTNGTKFDSSVDKGEPFSFVLGQRQVIAGWDEGVSTMRIGGMRKLVVPPQLGYGDRGAGGVIPPGATLVFDVQLLGAQ
jgi:peptidylprolyl isomerase